MCATTHKGAVIAILLIALCTGHFSAGVAAADAGLDDFKYAQGLYRQERWPLARDAFRQFLSKHPKHENVPLGTYFLGMTLLQLDRYEESRKTLRQFVKDNPKSREFGHATFRIAQCTYQLGQFDAAVTEFLQALSKYPDDSFREFAWAYLGDAQRHLKRYEDAAKSLQMSIDKFPMGRMAGEARFGLARVMESLGDPDKAIVLYREVVKSRDEERGDAAQLALANLYFGQKKFKTATVEYLALEKTFPTSHLVSIARLNAGFAQYQSGEFTAALELFDQARVDREQEVTAGYWMGLSLKALGDFSGAADVLTGTVKVGADSELAPRMTFQLADCLMKSGNLKDGGARFLEVTDRWPKDALADRSLYYATECALQTARLQKDVARRDSLRDADLMLTRFAREYKKSGIRFSHELQRALYFELRAGDGDFEAAERVYESVLAASKAAQTQRETRYQLARTRQSLGKTKEALEVLRPLVTEVMKEPKIGFSDSLILQSHLAIAESKFDEAATVALNYATHHAAAGRVDQAWAQYSVASARSGKWANVEKGVAKLLAEHAESPQLSRTLESVAETAFESQQWDHAIRYFETQLMAGKQSPFHAAALSGLAWSLYEKGDLEKSATRFEEFIVEHSNHKLASESAFMVGDALQKAGKLTDAGKAFLTAFEKYKPGRHAFLAGLQVARIHRNAKAYDEADRAYAAVDVAFRKHDKHDEVLNEWAVVMLEAEKFDRSDAVYQSLLEQHPDSRHAGRAGYSLAESALVNKKVGEARSAFLKLVQNAKVDSTIQEDSIYQLIGIDSDGGNWNAILAHVKLLGDRFPDSDYSAEARFREANAHLQLGRHESAELMLSDLADASGDETLSKIEWYSHVWPLLAEAQLLQKKYDEVMQTATKFRQWNPQSVIAYRVDEVVGRAWKNQARFDKAREAFSRTVNSKSGARTETAAKAQLMIAETWFLQKNFEEARNAYLKLHLLYSFPDWQAAALYQAGKCDEVLANAKGAVTSYRLLIKEFPESDYVADAKKRLQKLGG